MVKASEIRDLILKYIRDGEVDKADALYIQTICHGYGGERYTELVYSSKNPLNEALSDLRRLGVGSLYDTAEDTGESIRDIIKKIFENNYPQSLRDDVVRRVGQLRPVARKIAMLLYAHEAAQGREFLFRDITAEKAMSGAFGTFFGKPILENAVASALKDLVGSRLICWDKTSSRKHYYEIITIPIYALDVWKSLQQLLSDPDWSEVNRWIVGSRDISWVGGLVDKPSKALGVYLALLYIYFEWHNANFDFLPSVKEVTDAVQSIYAKCLAGREAEAKEALDAGEEFVRKLLLSGRFILNANDRNRVLDDIESRYIGKLGEAVKSCIKLDSLPDQLRERAANLLQNIAAGFYGRIIETSSGSAKVLLDPERIARVERVSVHEAEKLLDALKASGILIPAKDNHYIVPAPFLTKDFINTIKGPAEILPPPPKCIVDDIRTKEILEKIVASALKHLGFRVDVDVKKPSRDGRYDIDVDVWAEKNVLKDVFRVYVSCKNWDDVVGRPVIDQELGRMISLREMPHLRILVARDLTADAEKAAQTGGIFIIKLGVKATDANAEDLCREIYRWLGQLFTSIAPSRVREIASKLDEALKSISSVVEDIMRIKKELESLMQKPS